MKHVEDRINPEKIIVAGLVYSQKFHNELTKVKKELLSEVLQARSSRNICVIAFDYFAKYHVPPGAIIVESVRTRLAVAEDAEKDDLEVTAKLAESIIKSFACDENWDHRIDQAFQHIKARKLEVTKLKLELLLESGDIAAAEETVVGYSTVQKEAAAGLSLIKDLKAVARVLTAEQEECVVDFPGAIGQLIGPVERGDLVAFVSPAKRGKSWWLQEAAVRAMASKRTVVYYSLEMSEQQMLRRIAQRLTGQLKMSAQERDIEMPFFSETGAICMRKVSASGYSASGFVRKIGKVKLMSGTGDIHVCCFPAFSADVNAIKMHLMQLEKEKGIVPDVIVIDYADILAPGIKQDVRHQIDHTWKTLRALAQERSALIVTASHSNRSTLSKDMGQEDLSEDIRKLNHVSCMIGLNQQMWEKKLGIMRMTALAQRHEEFNSTDEVVVLYNYSTGRPLIDSRWRNDTNHDALSKCNEAKKKEQ